jgi:hypothetical protein
LCIVLLINFINNRVKSVTLSNVYDNVEKIAQEDDKYTFWTKAIFDQSDGKTGEFHLKYSDLSGDETFWVISSKENGSITFNYESTVNSGNFKVVLVNPDKKVENILEGTNKGNETIKLTGGEYRLKVVGRNTSGDIKFLITESKNVTFKRS